jgi:hypothetical protein
MILLNSCPKFSDVFYAVCDFSSTSRHPPSHVVNIDLAYTHRTMVPDMSPPYNPIIELFVFT